jgi:hypothetical protein
VRLRSGSADLTVVSVHEEDAWSSTIEVAWYAAAGEIRREQLPADALELLSKKPHVASDYETELEPVDAEPFLHVVADEPDDDGSIGIDVGDGIDLGDGD